VLCLALLLRCRARPTGLLYARQCDHGYASISSASHSTRAGAILRVRAVAITQHVLTVVVTF
jgi:hypothetical protein